MMVMMAPPMPMAPATPMNFDYVGCFGTVDRSAPPRKRTGAQRNTKQQRASEADCGFSLCELGGGS